MGLIAALALSPTLEVYSPDRSALTEILKSNRNLWVDICDPSHDEIKLLDSVFHFHPLSIEDCVHRSQRPKVEVYDDYSFMVIHALVQEKHFLKTTELNIFLGKTFVVTFHWNKLNAINDVLERCKRNSALLSKGVDLVTYQVLDSVVDEYFPLLDHIEEHLEAYEEFAFTKASNTFVNDIFKLRRQLLGIRKSLSPQREVINILLRHDFPYVKEENRVYYMDVYDHVLRLLDTTDSYFDLASNAIEAYLSFASNRLNEIMKVLTIITTIMMPLTVISGIYGMNFKYMPELQWKFGYPLVIIIMGMIVGLMLGYFKRKGWI